MIVAQAQRVRGTALFDLAVTAPMAVPGVADFYVGGLLSGFGLFGPVQTELPQTTSIFVVLFGILAVLWNGLRARYPDFAPMVFWDVCGRAAVAAALGWLVLFQGGPPVLALFVLTELGGAMIEYSALEQPSE